MAATSKSTSKTRAPKQEHGFTHLRRLSEAQAQAIKNFLAVSGETEDDLIARFSHLKPQNGFQFLDALINDAEASRVAAMENKDSTQGQEEWLETLVALAEEHGHTDLATSGNAVLNDMTADRAKFSTTIRRMENRLNRAGVVTRKSSEDVETDPQAISEAAKVTGTPTEEAY